MITQDAILFIIRQQAAEFTDLADTAILPTTTLEDMGLDSLEEVELTMRLEDAFDVDLLNAAIDFETIGEFMADITKQLETKNG